MNTITTSARFFAARTGRPERDAVPGDLLLGRIEGERFARGGPAGVNPVKNDLYEAWGLAVNCLDGGSAWSLALRRLRQWSGLQDEPA
jgi:hypothetical protein